jgi:hypothetical protein
LCFAPLTPIVVHHTCQSYPEASKETIMLATTTNTIEGHKIREYRGIVAGEAILGANVFKDFFASIRDIVGGGGLQPMKKF